LTIMEIIRTLVVDDSAFVRKAVRQMLSSSPQIEVVGLARNGEDALAMMEDLRPDVVTCDLAMPGLDGVEFVRAQMARKPVPILILSASPRDGERVLEALEAGAVDFVLKPTALASESLLRVREELVGKVKIAAKVSARPAPPAANRRPAAAFQSHGGAGKVDVVVLGVSTGGPQALRYLLPQFAANFPAPLVMVLHMPVGYTAIFAEKLAEISRLAVREAREGCLVRGGEALLAPAGRHLTFRRDSDGAVRVQLSLQPVDKPHRPSVDVLFQSAAETYRNRVLGVVMTGMGNDGTQGAAWIKAQGGIVLTESAESCIIHGMPRSVVESGLSDKSVSLAGMAEEIYRQL
jgi:two-component system chemotaxis response regulator CheB